MDTDTKKLSLAEALEDVATRATATQSVFLDKAVWAQMLDLKDQLSEAKKSKDLASPIPRLTAEIDQLNAQLKASELVLTFTELEPFEFEQLADKHANKSNPLLRWDEKTFAPALVAKTCIGVAGVYEADSLSVEDVAVLSGKLNQRQQQNLFATALGLQTVDIEPFTPAAATEPTPGSEQNSTTA